MFSYALQLEDEPLADPAMFTTAVPTWRPGDELVITPTQRYRVVAVDPHPSLAGVLVVEIGSPRTV